MPNLVLKFNDRNNFVLGINYFATESKYSVLDIDDEINTLYFSVKDIEDAYCIEYYIMQELDSTEIKNYYFEFE